MIGVVHTAQTFSATGLANVMDPLESSLILFLYHQRLKDVYIPVTGSGRPLFVHNTIVVRFVRHRRPVYRLSCEVITTVFFDRSLYLQKHEGTLFDVRPGIETNATILGVTITGTKFVPGCVSRWPLLVHRSNILRLTGKLMAFLFI